MAGRIPDGVMISIEEADRIMDWCKANGLFARTLAERVGVSQFTLQNALRGGCRISRVHYEKIMEIVNGK